jgi:hypothetical protein
MALHSCGRRHGARERPRRAPRDLSIRTDGDEAVEPAVQRGDGARLPRCALSAATPKLKALFDIWTAGGRHVPKGAPLPDDLEPQALAHLIAEGWAVPVEREGEEA